MATVQHSTQTGLELHEDKRVKEPVRAASTANVTLAAPGFSLDGVTLSSGDRILLKNQTAPAENGPYVWTGAATLLTRASDADAASDFVYGFLTYVREGSTNSGSYWTYTQATGPITLGTTAITFASFGAGSGSVTSVALTVPSEFSVSGSPVTSSGTLAVTKATQSANTVFAGPTGGGATAPAFRTVVSADLPVMGASGISHAAGAVPDPGASAGSTKFLREDATWQVPAGGGGGGGTTGGGGGSGALVPIMVVGPITATQATLPFAGIPQTGFRNLRVVVVARGTLAANNVNCGVQLNGDAGSNYGYEALADASGGLNRLSSAADTAAYVGFLPASTAGASEAGVLDIKIPNYTGTTFQKAMHAQGAFEQATSAGSQYNQDGGGFWRSTAAVTSLTVVLSSGSFDIGSYACLYGEMDTAGVLLTPASNLLYDSGPLTVATASINTGALSQAYRDLRVEVVARGDTAATQTQVQMQLNGDTAANYSSLITQNNTSFTLLTESLAAAQWAVGDIAAATAVASDVGTVTVVIPDYTGTTYNKRFRSYGGVRLATGTGNTRIIDSAGTWTGTAAVTSLLVKPAAGNFAAGSTIRVYGEPASAGGSAVGTGTRVRLGGNQSITTATATPITWDVEDNDADNQHFTSGANLTGTVTKTAASDTLTGSGTAFTTELSVGQVISVPGTAAEKRVVVSIASATSLRVNSPFVNSASAQTVARVNSAVVFRQSGMYTLEANIYSAALASGAVTLAFYLNSLTTATSGTAIGQRDPVAVNASAGYDLVAQRQFQQWDFVECVWTQNSGGSVNVLADERTHFSVNARPTVIVAVPYVRVVDSKAQNTNGGTFTTGGDRVRDLNTIDSDTAGIAALAANQITLPAGTYEYAVSAPGYQVGAHQAFLYNVTDTVEVKRGTAETSGTASGTTTSSVVSGKVTLSGPKVLEVRHRCTVTGSTNGFGLPANFGAEVYTVAEFRKTG